MSNRNVDLQNEIIFLKEDLFSYFVDQKKIKKEGGEKKNEK